MKKYKLTDECISLGRKKLYRIVALIDFRDIKKGDIGGYVESEGNLSHLGDSWVYGDAKVYGDTKVFGDAEVYDNAKVFGDAVVCGDAKVCGDARVCDNAEVCGDAKVYDNARVCGDAKVCGDARVCDNAEVFGDAKVCGDAEVCGDARIFGDAKGLRQCNDLRLTKQIGGDHYSKYTIEPVDFIVKNNLSYLQGNVIKYTVRYKDKNGKEDLQKAIHYLEMMLKDYD